MFKLMGREINAILGPQTILIWTYDILQDAARTNNKDSYAKFKESAIEGAKQCTLRGQMDFKYMEKPLDVSEVEDAASIVKRFVTGIIVLISPSVKL